MRLVVCPHAALAATIAETRPALAIVMHSPGKPPPALPAGTPLRAFAFNDVAAPSAGMLAPQGDIVAAILDAGRAAHGPLVVSCEMGISRGPAAAYALACAASPADSEVAIAGALRAASPVCTPNPLLVRLADEALGRGGRMIAAIAAIGRGADYAPYRSFVLDVPAERSPSAATAG